MLISRRVGLPVAAEVREGIQAITGVSLGLGMKASFIDLALHSKGKKSTLRATQVCLYSPAFPSVRPQS